jgi:GDPmannose 4,6-dehydratase
MKKVCLTGATGQLASFVIPAFLDKGYEVWGLKRSASNFNTQRIDHLFNNPNLHLVYGDLADYSSIVSFVSDIKPDIFLNIGALSHVAVSYQIPEYTCDITGTGVIRCLEAIRQYSPATKFVQMSTSELFGSSVDLDGFQRETTKMHPRSPYSCAKIMGYWATINYREAYNIFASNVISFNYESENRAENFLPRKLSRGLTRIKLGLQNKIKVGNLNSFRDWSFCGDIAEAVYLVATAEKSDDYVVASGETHSGQELLELICSKLKLNWKDCIEFDEKYLRPAEVDFLRGDANKIKTELGWKATLSFEQLVDRMIEHDLKLAQNEKIIRNI